MEDFGSIIWIVALAALLFGGGKKNKRLKEAARKALEEMQEEASRQEAWPTWEGEGKPLGQPVTPIPKPQPKSAHPLSLEEIPPTPEAVSLEVIEPEYPREASKRKLRGKNKAANKPIQPQTAPTTPSPKNEPDENCSAEEIREEFDLRKAVIYAEILKPKFEE